MLLGKICFTILATAAVLSLVGLTDAEAMVCALIVGAFSYLEL